MKTQLSHIYTQLDSNKNDESSLKITVEYDTVSGKVTKLIGVQAFNHRQKTWTDLTHIFFNCFHDQAEAIIDRIDWPDIYAREERKPTYNVDATIARVFEPYLK